MNNKGGLEVYVNKLKEICAKVVCDLEQEWTDDHGRLRKMVEEVAKPTKEKEEEDNVKYTKYKSSAMTSKQSMDKATISSDVELGEVMFIGGGALLYLDKLLGSRTVQATRQDRK